MITARKFKKRHSWKMCRPLVPLKVQTVDLTFPKKASSRARWVRLVFVVMIAEAQSQPGRKSSEVRIQRRHDGWCSIKRDATGRAG